MAAGQGTTTATMIISLVGVELTGPMPGWSPGLPDGRHSIDYLLQHDAVVDVGPCQADRERDALRIRENVTRGRPPYPDPSGWDLSPSPLLAATEALSRAARWKSMALRRPRRSRSTRWSFSQTPACCQSRKRRQQSLPPGFEPRVHARSAAHLLGQHRLRDAGAQNEQNACQGSAIRPMGASALGVGRLRRQQRRDHRPDGVRHKRLAHTLLPHQIGFH